MRRARENLRFMEDMARMAGSFTEIRSHIKGLVKDGLDRVLSEMDMVTRAEFDRVEAVAVKARERQEQLEKRVRDLEKQLKNKKAKK
jgi:BMFP domain-containing protein YqiC